MAQDRIITDSGVTTRKSEVDKFITEATSFITNTDSPIKKIDKLSTKYSVVTIGELRGEGKGQTEINQSFTNLGDKIKKNLDTILEEYAQIETTSMRITSRIEELEMLAKLSTSYTELISQNSTNSPDFGSKFSKIRMEQAAKIPSIMKKKVEEIGSAVKDAIEAGAPKLLTPKEIEKIIRDKYGDAMTPEQIKLLAESLFKNCNSLEITTKGMKYEVTITKDGKYIVNGVETTKSDFDILFGNLKSLNKNKMGDMKTDLDKNLGTIEFGFERGMEVVMMEFLQNGIPLIESADGRIQMIKNTQIDVIKGYIKGDAKAKIQGTNTSVSFDAKIGVDIVNVQSDILTIRIPWTDKNITIHGNLGVGIKAGASGKASEHKKEASIEGGMGVTGKLKGKIEDQDFRTETTKDFTF